MRSLLRSLSAHQFFLAPSRQRGASLTEYTLILSVGLMMSSMTYQRYGDVVRTHVAQMANKFSEYYYQGWFWPEDDVAGNGGPATAGQGQSGNGNPSSGGPSAPGSSGNASNGSSGAGGNTNSGEGDTGSGNGSSNNSNGSTASNTGSGNNLGNNLNPGSAGNSPLQCTGGNTSNNSNPFSPTTSSSVAMSSAPSFTQVGNPIDLGSGNKFQSESDYEGSGDHPLTFVRYYNSVLMDRDDGIGKGWRHTYQRHLDIDAVKNTATVWRDDGTQYSYRVTATDISVPVGVVDRLQRTAQGWQYNVANGDRETYDSSGRLQRIDYPDGHTHTFIYDKTGKLSSVGDDRGRTLRLSWDDRHLSRIELPNGQRLHYGYDGYWNLDDVTRTTRYTAWFAALKTPQRRYHYDDTRHPHALTGLDDATGVRFATWGYDDIGRAILSQHGDGAEKITIAYGETDATTGYRRAIVTNAAGLSVTYVLEAAGNGKYRLRDIDGHPMLNCAAVQNHHRYDTNGFLQTQFNADRIGSSYARNRRGLIETEQNGLRFDEREVAYVVVGSTRIERTWDQAHPWLLRETHSSWQIDATHPQGRWQPVAQRAFTYDEQGRVLTDTTTDLMSTEQTASRERTRRYVYEFSDSAHTELQIATLIDANGNATAYRYEHDQLRSIENPLHQRTRFDEYNADGHPETLHLPNGQVLHITYNDQQLPIRLVRESNAEKEITEAAYDAVGRLIQLTRPDGSEQHYQYNAAGQLTQLKNNWGEIIARTPNALHGDWEEQELFDRDGNTVQRQHRRFNALGQLTAVLGNHGQQSTFDYSASGDLITVSEGSEDPAHAARNHITHAAYDTQHRLLTLIDAAGYRTQYAPSAGGSIETVTDANDNTTEYQRNGFGEIIKQISPTTGTIIKRYDGSGNLIANESPSGAAIRFEYDALNRLTKVDYPGEENDIHYVYDQTDKDHGNGVQQLTRIETQNQIIDYRYDALGRKIEERATDKTTVDKTVADQKPLSPRERGEGTTTLHYAYLPGNRLQQITYPDGSVVHYHYDKNRIDSVSYTDDKTQEAKILIKEVAYAPFSGPVAWTYGNGLRQTKQLDQDGRVTDIALNKTTFNKTQSLWSQHYQYDLYQNIEQVQREQLGAKGLGLQQTQSFAYDPLKRLTEEKSDKRVQRIDYDALGNRLSVAANDDRQTSSYGRGNQQLVSGDTHLLQERGNTLIEKTGAATRFTYYDGSNRTSAVVNNKRLTATYGYDARGWRNRKTTRGPGTTPITQRFAYAPDGKLLSESNIHQRKNYVWLSNTPIAQIERTENDVQIIYLHSDHLNTPRIASNDEEQIVWAWQGDAFGNGIPNEDPDGDKKLTQINLRFPGQYADAETGLFYNLHRYYDPQKGRYTQSDLLGLADGNNSFAYVQNNPLSGADPFGLYNAYTHFYMTYFLAIVSGLPEETALKIALATQYIDENSPTQPTSASGFGNDALSKYHFTLDYAGPNHGDQSTNPLTRFDNPSSAQLSRLYGITMQSTLQQMWLEAHPAPENAGYCPMPNQGDINNARYQFYGEYLHAYEDTFAHRDMNNMAYDKWSFNDRNQPHADIGHINIVEYLVGGDGWEYPDQTFNSEDNAIQQSCSKSAGGPKGGGNQTRHDLDAAGCSAWGGSYTAAASWQYNELRTLRMEYEVLSKLQNDFSTEIATNKADGGKTATWSDLAGTADWDANAARIGGNPVEKGQFISAQNADKLQSVLQQFNAAGNADKYKVLDDWLRKNNYITSHIPQLAVTKNAGLINEDSYLKGTNSFTDAEKHRADFLKWIPGETHATSGVLPGAPSGGNTGDGKRNTQIEFGVILPMPQQAPVVTNAI